MGRVRILKDWNVSYPYPIQAQTQTKTLDEGQRTDVKHFRRMVALIIKKCHPDYRTQLPITFKLFFSKNFLLEHYTLQFLHPLFYGSNERLHFIHLIQEYKNKVSESYDLFNLNEEQYGIYNWIATVVDSKDGFLNEVLNHENDLQAYKAGKATTLPRFVRNLHNHPHSKVCFLSFMLCFFFWLNSPLCYVVVVNDNYFITDLCFLIDVTCYNDLQNRRNVP